MIDWLKCLLGRHNLRCKAKMVGDDIVTVSITCSKCIFGMLTMTKVNKSVPRISMLKE